MPLLIFLSIAFICLLFVGNRKLQKKKEAQIAATARVTGREKYKEAEKKRNEKILEVRQQLQTGKWPFPTPFPAEDFYRRCKENNIFLLDNEFSCVKATKLAESIVYKALLDLENVIDSDAHRSLESSLTREEREFYNRPSFPAKLSNVDSSEFSSLIRKECLEKYLAEGKVLAEAADKKELAKQKIPRNASPNLEEQAFIRRAAEISNLVGNQKRVKMLSYLIQELDAQITKLREAEKATKELAWLYLQQQKKEKSWGTVGGLAEGIAGPAAGLAAALQVMENNREIQQYNAAMRDLSRDTLNGMVSISNDQIKLGELYSEALKRCREAKDKITISEPNADEIRNHIKVGKYQIKKEENGVLHIALPVRIKPPFALDVPQNVNTVIDGTLTAEVRCERRSVGFVNFPLPLYGIPTNMTEEVILDGMLDRSMEFDGKYTLKMSDSHNLWIMEA